MEKFKVWRRVKRSEAKGHKLLTSKWVHKRKLMSVEKQTDSRLD